MKLNSPYSIMPLNSDRKTDKYTQLTLMIEVRLTALKQQARQ